MIDRFSECLNSLETSLEEQKDFYSRYLYLQECRENLYRNLMVFTSGFFALIILTNFIYFFISWLGFFSEDNFQSIIAFNKALSFISLFLVGGFVAISTSLYRDAFLRFIQSPLINSQWVDCRSIIRLQELETKTEIISLVTIDSNWSLTKKWCLVFASFILGLNLIVSELQWLNLFLIPLLYVWTTPLVSKAVSSFKPRSREFWKERDSLGVCNAAKFILKNEELIPRTLEKGDYLEKEFFLALETLVKEGPDQMKTFCVNYLLMNPSWLKYFPRIINEKNEFGFNKETLAWIVFRILKGDLATFDCHPLIKKKLAYLEFLVTPGKRYTTWELAVFSQNLKFVKLFYIANIEFEPIQGYGDLSSCLFSSELREWAKEYTMLFKHEAFGLIGGWTKDYILIGSSSLPFKELEKITGWESLGLKNKRLKDIFYKKLFLSLEEVSLRGEFKELISLRRPEELEKLRFISGSLLHFILMIRDLKLDLNIVANFIEKFNWGAIPYNYGIWRPVTFTFNLPDHPPGEKSSLVRHALWQLLKHYSPEKALKIIFSSLSLDEMVWLDTLSQWLQMSSKPEVFYPPTPPRKVKDLTTLHKYFSWAVVHCQNPNLSLDQVEIKTLEGLSFRDYEIIVPKYNRDLIVQGQALQICLGNSLYYDKVVGKEGFILFLTKNSKNEKVDYVVEITPQGFVRQARTFGNSHLSIDDTESLSNLCSHLLQERINENK